MARATNSHQARRRRCFISYDEDDREAAARLVAEFGEVFLPTALGVTDGAEFVDSQDHEYIKRRIRELHLATTSLTIVLVGRCTWSRRFIDWEIASSLRDAPRNKRSGLLALAVPGLKDPRLPDRVGDNWVHSRPEASYADFRPYPRSAAELRSGIEAAFSARTSKAHLVENSRPLRAKDSRCR